MVCPDLHARARHLRGLDFFFPIKKQLREAGEAAYQLRTLAALPEDLESTPSTHMAAHNCL